MQLPATSVTIDGKPAETTTGKGTLRVTPAKPLSRGQRLTVHVTYQSSPRCTLDDPTMDNPAWAATEDGGHYLALGTAGLLFPANTDRSDRSAVHVQATVPEEPTAVSHGPATAPRKEGGHKGERGEGLDVTDQVLGRLRPLAGGLKPVGEAGPVDGVGLTPRRGELIALIGENGSGRTTLSALLTGVRVVRPQGVSGPYGHPFQGVWARGSS
ncbi:ATP-binding cassette domain-containing protein [Streptomyces celluloflavus]|uniref:ATP-binding cassette domain-containing protein n=1 Tax=Streptomyces celluloflavus TaxID=58344 RepID=UPI00364B25CF